MPPVTVVVILPLLPPLQFTLLVVAVTAIVCGCDKVDDTETLHPLISVTVAVYVPAARPDTDALVEPLFHIYE